MRLRPEIVTYLSDRLLEVAATVPDRVPTFALGGRGAAIFGDERLFDYERYPEAMWAKPGEKKPNRAALATWGSWINSYAKKEHGRPLFIAMSADLASRPKFPASLKPFAALPAGAGYSPA